MFCAMILWSNSTELCSQLILDVCVTFLQVTHGQCHARPTIPARAYHRHLVKLRWW